jgi:sigma-E factor negative regulatory protein RseA
MNTETNQKISQFLDDELHHTELENLLLTMKQQPDSKKKINRYQLMTQVMRTDEVPIVNVSFLEKINQQLEHEPLYFPPQSTRNKKPAAYWQKTSLAIAASVACIAVVISQQTTTENVESMQIIAQNPPVIVQAKLQAEIVKAKEVNVLQPSQHERLKAYLQAHSNDLYTYGSLDVHPLAHVASFTRD